MGYDTRQCGRGYTRIYDSNGGYEDLTGYQHISTLEDQGLRFDVSARTVAGGCVGAGIIVATQYHSVVIRFTPDDATLDLLGENYTCSSGRIILIVSSSNNDSTGFSVASSAMEGSFRVWSYRDSISSSTATFKQLTINSLTVTAEDGTEYDLKTILTYDGDGSSDPQFVIEKDPNRYYYYYSLDYDANGGSGAPSSQRYPTSSSSYAGNTTSLTDLRSYTYTFTISSAVPVRDGYTFLGWSTSRYSTTVSYQPGETITVNARDDTTLYAVWAEIGPSYSVYVKADGTWHEAEAVYVRDGEWREADSVHVKADGAWAES